jgi:hypothetical protein
MWEDALACESTTDGKQLRLGKLKQGQTTTSMYPVAVAQGTQQIAKDISTTCKFGHMLPASAGTLTELSCSWCAFQRDNDSQGVG